MPLRGVDIAQDLLGRDRHARALLNLAAAMTVKYAIGPAHKTRCWYSIQARDQIGVRGFVDLDRDFPQRAILIAPYGTHMLEDQIRLGDHVEHADEATRCVRRLDLEGLRNFHLR